MKFKSLLFFFLIPFLLSGFHCKKDKTPLEQLPPETQVGAGTFGCLVNDDVFEPIGDPLGGPTRSCAYQFINGGYYLQLSARQDISNGDELSVGIFTDSLTIQQDQKILLVNRFIKGKAYAQYIHYSFSGTFKYYTDSISNGEIQIKYLDQVNRIVSGTFWFDAINSAGEKVQVRNGRFDMKYTL